MHSGERRPALVTAAYSLWLVGAVVCVYMGVVYLFVSEDTLVAARDELNDPGGLANLLRMYGGIALASGIMIGALSGFVRKGNPRVRRSLVAFSIVLALFQTATIAISGLYAVIIVICVIAASVLVYRPAAKPWFDR
ncbi:hypothetical protein ONR57_16775 [Hoyosella sp. YIM 151337]|uniref:hypothetical protein n=1 Tax=Hoyosella sp. YIM 151337 TaxID=2992742 RepID=UPI0022360407|nr:hypothetical protein [Hoyosella sp. YIM 151337]MCW4354960.1 hypothetical protein [Hoyosella sp. YIM 151337]